MKRKLLILLLIIITCCLSTTSAADERNINEMLDNITGQYADDTFEKHSLFIIHDKNNTTENQTDNDTDKFDKSRPIYFAMDHTNSNDRQIRDTIVNRLESEGFNVVKAEIGPNKMSQNTLYLYNHNISNAIVFHLFNGVDPSTIRELGTNGNDNRGRIVRERGNDVVLAWFYDSIDCVNENASGLSYIHGSETGAGLENPHEYMEENDIKGICTSSDMGKHKEDADYTGEKTVEEFIKLFNT